MEAPACPICQGEVTRVETVEVAALAIQYRRQLSIDVAGEFGPAGALQLNRCPRCDFASFFPPVTGSVKFYEALQENEWYYLEDKPEFVTARRFIKPADRVLDVGCGSGAFAGNHPTANYVGLEYTATSVARARARNLTVVQEGVEQYALTKPEPFDVVCAFQVLEHVADQRLFIEACLDVCRPGGKLIFSTPNADAFVNAAKNCVLNLPPHHTAWFSRQLWLNVPDHFPLKILEVIEESFEPVHRQFFANTLVQASLERWLGLPSPPLVDNSLRNRIVGKIARQGGRLLARGLLDRRLQPKGQSITAVYEKR